MKWGKMQNGEKRGGGVALMDFFPYMGKMCGWVPGWHFQIFSTSVPQLFSLTPSPLKN